MATVLHNDEHDGGGGIRLSITTRQFFSKNVIDAVDYVYLLAYDLIAPTTKQGKRVVAGQPHHAAMESVTTLVENVLYQGDCPPTKFI